VRSSLICPRRPLLSTASRPSPRWAPMSLPPLMAPLKEPSSLTINTTMHSIIPKIRRTCPRTAPCLLLKSPDHPAFLAAHGPLDLSPWFILIIFSFISGYLPFLLSFSSCPPWFDPSLSTTQTNPKFLIILNDKEVPLKEA